MNEARETYLSSYGAIDRIDHRIRNCKLYVRSWKYWHSAMIQAYGLAIVTCYDMYLELCEGKLAGFSETQPMSFKAFRNKLAEQLCNYNPRKHLLKGDENFRANTQLAKLHRAPGSGTQKRRPQDHISKADYDQEKREQPRSKKARFCKDFASFCTHLNSRVQIKSGKNCAVCNNLAFTGCGICQVTLHFPNG